jgi:hypothetical protein
MRLNVMAKSFLVRFENRCPSPYPAQPAANSSREPSAKSRPEAAGVALRRMVVRGRLRAGQGI